MPSLVSAVSKMAVNLLSRSRIKNVNRADAVAEVHQEVPRLLGDPGSGGVRRDAEEVDAAGGVLHNEQHIEPVQQ
jgi:hypothetical protein